MAADQRMAIDIPFPLAGRHPLRRLPGGGGLSVHGQTVADAVVAMPCGIRP